MHHARQIRVQASKRTRKPGTGKMDVIFLPHALVMSSPSLVFNRLQPSSLVFDRLRSSSTVFLYSNFYSNFLTNVFDRLHSSSIVFTRLHSSSIVFNGHHRLLARLGVRSSKATLPFLLIATFSLSSTRKTTSAKVFHEDCDSASSANIAAIL